MKKMFKRTNKKISRLFWKIIHYVFGADPLIYSLENRIDYAVKCIRDIKKDVSRLEKLHDKEIGAILFNPESLHDKYDAARMHFMYETPEGTQKRLEELAEEFGHLNEGVPGDALFKPGDKVVQTFSTTSKELKD